MMCFLVLVCLGPDDNWASLLNLAFNAWIFSADFVQLWLKNVEDDYLPTSLLAQSPHEFMLNLKKQPF